MALTILIPTSQADIDRLKYSVDSMEFHGGLERHTVLFCPTPSVQDQVAEQAARIRAICPNTFVDPLPREPEQIGRFGAFNLIFRDAVNLRRMMDNKNPWMWWENDMTTLSASPFDRLELEYNRKGALFMGVRRKATEVMRNDDGSPLDEKDQRAQGDYMVAVGIYPPNFRDISTMFRYPDPTGKMPTDVLIRHEINKYLHHTDLICHQWNTGNFKRNERGEIEGQDFKPQANFPSYAGVINPMAIVHHGCKDGSLSQLVLSTTSAVTVSMAVPQSNPNSDALVKQLSAKLDELGKANEELAKENRQLKEDIKTLIGGASDVTAPTTSAPTITQTTVIPPVAASSVLPPIEKLHEALAGGKKIMLGDLAADFGVDKLILRQLIETPGSKMKIGKPGPPFVSMVA